MAKRHGLGVLLFEDGSRFEAYVRLKPYLMGAKFWAATLTTDDAIAIADKSAEALFEFDGRKWKVWSIKASPRGFVTIQTSGSPLE